MPSGSRFYKLLPLDFQAWVPVPHNDKDCWNWTGQHHASTGRALCMHKGRKGRQAIDWAYELHYGKPPVGHKVLPRCRNKSCVNPNHLMAVPRR